MQASDLRNVLGGQGAANFSDSAAENLQQFGNDGVTNTFNGDNAGGSLVVGDMPNPMDNIAFMEAPLTGDPLVASDINVVADRANFNNTGINGDKMDFPPPPPPSTNTKNKTWLFVGIAVVIVIVAVVAFTSKKATA